MMLKSLSTALLWCVLNSVVLAEDGAGLNHVANAYVIICAILVIMMSIPGIGLFYAGLVRAKNCLSVFAECTAVFSLVFVMWVIVGYSLVFAENAGAIGAFIGSFEKVFLKGVEISSLSGELSEYTFITFQGAFCAISAALIVGALVERIKFLSLILGIIFWALLSYVPIAHMIWAGGFIDSIFAPYDFAGGDVVHINAACAALVAALMLGKRADLGKVSLSPHNLSLTYIGTGFLYLGWFGFNAGSALTSDGVSALALLNTVLCPVAAALTWALIEYFLNQKSSTLGLCSGILAGLVAITTGCAYIGPMGAIITGVLAAGCCVFGVRGFKTLTHIDDSLDVFGIHGIGAIVGALTSGVFCAPFLGGVGFKGHWDSILGQVTGQLSSVLITLVWSSLATLIAFKLAGFLTGGLRVSHDMEREGLDLASHGERGYNL